MSGDHFYTLDPRGELAPASYEHEGIAAYVYETQQANTVPAYRWYNETSGDHFYTTDPNGELAPRDYKPEGIAWYMFQKPIGNAVPLYRWFSNRGDHFYTIKTNEPAPGLGYTEEGIAGYVHEFQDSGTVPLYRWFNNGLLNKFTFDSSVSPEHRRILLERHAWAHFRAGVDRQFLTDEERTRVRNLYFQGIAHTTEQRPNVNASAQVGGRYIAVNFNVLFPAGDDEIAQTLLHEMMHCAGYTHPKRVDPPAPNADTPYDNGKYYGTAPLRAELCIAGAQSDTATAPQVSLPRAGRVTQEACPVIS